MDEDFETIDLEGVESPYVPCHLTVDPGLNRMIVVGYGGVWDGQLPDEWGALEEDPRIQFLLEDDEPRIKAMVVHQPHDVDPGELSDDVVWSPDIGFDVPALGLHCASVGELILAVQGRYERDERTADVAYFDAAIEAAGRGDLEEAATSWKLVLESGDMKGHYGLGYTLHDLGRHREAYSHLRYYTWLTPRNAWAWCWLGKVCEELGERSEAIDAYRRAANPWTRSSPSKPPR